MSDRIPASTCCGVKPLAFTTGWFQGKPLWSATSVPMKATFSTVSFGRSAYVKTKLYFPQSGLDCPRPGRGDRESSADGSSETMGDAITLATRPSVTIPQMLTIVTSE